ncbi:MAG TPA: hypothetical protein VH157_10335 [Bryobacteraceae bacterium]|nr:hypothetical protein [Bryobacteraceae bacterium]
MRTKLNLDGSNRRVAERLASVPGLPAGMPPGMPMEWLDAGNWRLPSGKALAEFALQAGFLAPLLFRTERLGSADQFPGEASPAASATLARAKHFGKGSNR